MKQLPILLLLALAMSCSLKKENRNTSNAENDNLTYTSFYRDSDRILESTRNRKSEYYGIKILKKFIETPEEIKDSESVALMYVGISHKGYQHPDLKMFEDNCYRLFKEKKLSEAKKQADQALSIFPFSLKAIWVKYLLSAKNDTLKDLYFNQLRTMSGGIMKSGNSYKEDHPFIVFDENCFYVHSTYLVPEARYKLKENHIDQFGNSVFTCTNTIQSEEVFIIPKKTWANKK